MIKVRNFLSLKKIKKFVIITFTFFVVSLALLLIKPIRVFVCEQSQITCKLCFHYLWPVDEAPIIRPIDSPPLTCEEQMINEHQHALLKMKRDLGLDAKEPCPPKNHFTTRSECK